MILAKQQLREETAFLSLTPIQYILSDTTRHKRFPATLVPRKGSCPKANKKSPQPNHSCVYKSVHVCTYMRVLGTKAAKKTHDFLVLRNEFRYLI